MSEPHLILKISITFNMSLSMLTHLIVIIGRVIKIEFFILFMQTVFVCQRRYGWLSLKIFFNLWFVLFSIKITFKGRLFLPGESCLLLPLLNKIRKLFYQPIGYPTSKFQPLSKGQNHLVQTNSLLCTASG